MLVARRVRRSRAQHAQARQKLRRSPIRRTSGRRTRRRPRPAGCPTASRARPRSTTRSSRRRRSSATPRSQQLLARATPLQAAGRRQTGVRAAAVVAPPPRTGDTIKDTFPPPPSTLLPPPANDAGKDLRVLRYMPRGRGAARARAVGDVQPADGRGDVAGRRRDDVAGEADADAEGHVALDRHAHDPVRSRGPRSRRRRRTRSRFPRARSRANGGVLKDASKFSVRDAGAEASSATYPSSYMPQQLDVPMFVMFDQKIDPQAVLATIKVTGGEGLGRQAARAARCSMRSEIAKDKQLAALRRGRAQGRARRPLARVPHRRRRCRSTRRSRSTVPAGHAVGRGPEHDEDVADVHVPHLPPLRCRGRAVRLPHSARRAARCRSSSTTRSTRMRSTRRWSRSTPDDPRHAGRSRAGPRSSRCSGATKPRTTYKVTIGEGARRRVRPDARPARSRTTFKIGDALPDVLRAERHGRARSARRRSRRSTSSRRTTTRSRSSSTRSSPATCTRSATTSQPVEPRSSAARCRARRSSTRS